MHGKVNEPVRQDYSNQEALNHFDELQMGPGWWTGPYWERGVGWQLREGVCQQEYVIHADAQSQKGQDLEVQRGDINHLEEPCSLEVAPKGCPKSWST